MSKGEREGEGEGCIGVLHMLVFSLILGINHSRTLSREGRPEVKERRREVGAKTRYGRKRVKSQLMKTHR